MQAAIHVTGQHDQIVIETKLHGRVEAAKREDLATIERDEIIVIQSYLPAQLSADELATEITRAIAESGAAGPQDMGKVMAVLKPRIAGRADMGQASGLVKQKLSG